MQTAKRKKRLVVNQITPATNLIITIFMIILCIGTIFPLLLCFMISISSLESISEVGYTLFPKEISFIAYEYLFKAGQNMWRAYGNTIFYTAFGTVLSLLVMSMFAYVLSRKQLRWRYGLALYTYGTALFGGGLAAAYILTTRVLRIDDTIWVFILPGLVSPFNVIMLRTFIQTSIPESLIESAKLDGASEFQVYWRIVLPLFKAGLATIGLFGVVGRWNDWFTAVLYVRNQKLWPIMTLLQQIERSMAMLKEGSPAAATAEGIRMLSQMPSESTRIAIMMFAILPLLVCYPFFQKYFIKGMTVGSVKG